MCCLINFFNCNKKQYNNSLQEKLSVKSNKKTPSSSIKSRQTSIWSAFTPASSYCSDSSKYQTCRERFYMDPDDYSLSEKSTKSATTTTKSIKSSKSFGESTLISLLSDISKWIHAVETPTD